MATGPRICESAATSPLRRCCLRLSTRREPFATVPAVTVGSRARTEAEVTFGDAGVEMSRSDAGITAEITSVERVQAAILRELEPSPPACCDPATRWDFRLWRQRRIDCVRLPYLVSPLKHGADPSRAHIVGQR